MVVYSCLPVIERGYHTLARSLRTKLMHRNADRGHGFNRFKSLILLQSIQACVLPDGHAAKPDQPAVARSQKYWNILHSGCVKWQCEYM